MAKQLGGGDGIREQTPGMRGGAAPAHRPQRPDPSPRSAKTPPPAPPGDAPDLAEPLTDRLRYLDAATRRIARGMNLDETLWELCRAAVPAFADRVFIHLYAPLPVGEETAAEPGVLRLHCTDRSERRDPDAPAAEPPPTDPTDPHDLPATESVRPVPGSPLAGLLRDAGPGRHPGRRLRGRRTAGHGGHVPGALSRATTDPRPAARPHPRPGQRPAHPRIRPGELHRRRPARRLPARHAHRARPGEGDAVRA
jgi:hypothetical protein